MIEYSPATNDNNIEQVQVQHRSNSNIFKISLPESRYTFIVKCTPVRKFNLYEQEKAIYRYLERLQGSIIPVFLDNFVQLFGEWKYHTLMSYSGTSMAELDTLPSSLVSIEDTVNKLHLLGLKHGDLAPRNILFDKGTRTFFLIDFEYSQAVIKEGTRQDTNLDTTDMRRYIKRQFDFELAMRKPWIRTKNIKSQLVLGGMRHSS